LIGCETYGYLADATEEMDLAGVESAPRALGRHAFDWLDGQLRRPVERATWKTWRGARSVRLADTGEPVWGHLARRLRDRQPDSVVLVR
jgi:hypothetical protein